MGTYKTVSKYYYNNFLEQNNNSQADISLLVAIEITPEGIISYFSISDSNILLNMFHQ